MKQFFKLSMALIGLVAVSCTQSRFSPYDPARYEQDESLSTVEMKVDDIVFGDLTKTEASVDETAGLIFRWSEKDTVGVYSADGGFSRYSLDSGSGMQSATFDGQGFKLTPGNSYYAIYPYDGGKSDPSSVSVSYEGRAVSGVDQVSDILAYDPLFSSATATTNGGANFTFSHFSSFARLSMTFPKATDVTSIDLLPTYDGIVPGGKMNLLTGLWTPSGGKTVTTIPVSNVSTSNNGQEVKLWLPFAPQNFKSNDIAAVVKGPEGQLLTSRMNGKDMQSGKAYRWGLDMVEYSNDKESSVTLSDHSTTILTLGITGQFSGITKITDGRYAVVHDAKAGGGIVFLNFTVDSYYYLKNLSYEIPDGTANGSGSRGAEGVVYFPDNGTLFVAGENDQRILEYDMDGYPTGREMTIPADMGTDKIAGNAGFETLAYNQNTGLFWTTTESDIVRDREYDSNGRMLLRLQSFGEDLKPAKRYFYLMDKARKDKNSASIYAYGVPDILALDDGKLLVIEREAFIPDGDVLDIEFNTVVYINIYEVDPVNDKGGILSKRKVFSKTFTRADSFANYEGIGFGPVVNGKQTVLLICDSQDHYKYVLQDKIRVLTIQ